MPRTEHRRIARAAIVIILSSAMLGCGGDDGTDDATEPIDVSTTTAPAAVSGACPVSADDVSDAIGAAVVVANSDQLEMLIPDPAIRSRADVLCLFSADSSFGLPLVAVISSDDPEAEAGARSILDGNEALPVDGVGDQAVASGGELIFQSGDTWTIVLAAVGSDPALDQEAAIAVAHLMGG